MVAGLTQEELKELIHYNPDTGIFTWKPRSIKWFKTKRTFNWWNGRYSNTVAGNLHTSVGKTYNIIRINYKAYKAHRLAFLYMNGNFPIEEVDHEDGNGINNKFSNLRLVNHRENSKNRRKRSNNTSGVTGVGFCKTKLKYVTHIVDTFGNHINLGTFNTFQEAIKVRKEAEIKYNYHKNHGIERPL